MKCEYGCGTPAKYQFKNGKWCCSKSANSCDRIRDKNSKANEGRIISEDSKIKMRKARLGIKDSQKTRKKKSDARKGKKNPMYGKIHPCRKTSKDVMNEHPFFSKIEEIRDDPKNKRIQVRCKLHTCRKWFTPTHDQLRYRIYELEHIDGKDGLFFYCSEECKHKCPPYNVKPPRIVYKIKTWYTQSEHQTFRKFILERDDYICQYCDEPATDVHHERPQKLEPFFALDPDFAWSCCEKCHYEKGHKNECSTRKIGLKVCNG